MSHYAIVLIAAIVLLAFVAFSSRRKAERTRAAKSRSGHGVDDQVAAAVEDIATDILSAKRPRA